MKAMVLHRICDLTQTREPLEFAEVPAPVPGSNELLVRVSACGVCHTELDEIEGRTPPPTLPMILGHQVVGIVEQAPQHSSIQRGDRVGIAWIFSSCGHCEYCLSGNENLCAQFKATGRDANGGYAQYMTVPERFAYPIPANFNDVDAAPLLCAGAIGFRSLSLTNLKNGQLLGLTGFGASGHLVLMMARHKYPQSPVYVFARSEKERAFAQELGAAWVGDSEAESPEKLHTIIDTTPVWKPAVAAMKNLRTGGRLVINAIRKENADQSALAQLDYPSHLWLEKEIKSVANVARSDVSEFLQLAATIPIRPEVQVYPLRQANTALLELKERKIRGAKVLIID